MMTVRLDDATRQLLEGPHTAILATTNADGRPQSTVIFVKQEGDSIVFSTIKGRLKTRNMTRDPRVSLLVMASAGRYVEVRGSVDIQEDPENRLGQEMYRLYMDGAAPPPEPGAERLFVRITPERLYHWPPLPGPS